MEELIENIIQLPFDGHFPKRRDVKNGDWIIDLDVILKPIYGDWRPIVRDSLFNKKEDRLEFIKVLNKWIEYYGTYFIAIIRAFFGKLIRNYGSNKEHINEIIDGIIKEVRIKSNIDLWYCL